MGADDKVKEVAEQVLDGFRKQLSRLWIIGALIIVVVVSMKSCITLEAGEVAVRVNNITGAQETLTRPGLVLRLPFGIHSVHIMDASPQTFHMQGTKFVSDLHVEELTVRASDGSNFVFKDTTIIFRVVGDQAQALMQDAGRGDRFKAWLRPYVRSILRDEFGRESTISVSNPATFGEATQRCKERMNTLLAKHGIEVSSIVTPRPIFAAAYEELIEARNEAENQLTVIASELERAATGRQRELAEVDRDQNHAIQEKRAQFEAELATAVTSQAETTQELDTYRIQKVGAGQAALSGATYQAEQLEGELTAKYVGRKAEIDAFRTQPVERVMERLGERLQGVTISIQPYSEDGTPSRVKLEGNP